MTPTRFRECLDAIDWSQRGIARHLDRQEGTVRQWARGSVRIPEDVADWLETLTTFHEAHPAPTASHPRQKVEQPELA
jgi:hypothetical protein